MAETLSILAFEHKNNMEASIYNEATSALIFVFFFYFGGCNFEKCCTTVSS